MDEALEARIRKINDEKKRIEREQDELKAEIFQNLESLKYDIGELESKLARMYKQQSEWESFLGIEVEASRASHGTIKELCFEVLRNSPNGLTSAEVKAIIQTSHPDIKIASIPAALSYQFGQGRLERDHYGRYRIKE